jgi:hypothetical protein
MNWNVRRIAMGFHLWVIVSTHNHDSLNYVCIIMNKDYSDLYNYWISGFNG